MVIRKKPFGKEVDVPGGGMATQPTQEPPTEGILTAAAGTETACPVGQHWDATQKKCVPNVTSVEALKTGAAELTRKDKEDKATKAALEAAELAKKQQEAFAAAEGPVTTITPPSEVVEGGPAWTAESIELLNKYPGYYKEAGSPTVGSPMSSRWVSWYTEATTAPVDTGEVITDIPEPTPTPTPETRLDEFGNIWEKSDTGKWEFIGKEGVDFAIDEAGERIPIAKKDGDGKPSVIDEDVDEDVVEPEVNPYEGKTYAELMAMSMFGDDSIADDPRFQKAFYEAQLLEGNAFYNQYKPDPLQSKIWTILQGVPAKNRDRIQSLLEEQFQNFMIENNLTNPITALENWTPSLDDATKDYLVSVALETTRIDRDLIDAGLAILAIDTGVDTPTLWDDEIAAIRAQLIAGGNSYPTTNEILIVLQTKTTKEVLRVLREINDASISGEEGEGDWSAYQALIEKYPGIRSYAEGLGMGMKEPPRIPFVEAKDVFEGYVRQQFAGLPKDLIADLENSFTDAWNLYFAEQPDMDFEEWVGNLPSSFWTAATEEAPLTEEQGDEALEIYGGYVKKAFRGLPSGQMVDIENAFEQIWAAYLEESPDMGFEEWLESLPSGYWGSLLPELPRAILTRFEF